MEAGQAGVQWEETPVVRVLDMETQTIPAGLGWMETTRTQVNRGPPRKPRVGGDNWGSDKQGNPQEAEGRSRGTPSRPRVGGNNWSSGKRLTQVNRGTPSRLRWEGTLGTQVVREILSRPGMETTGQQSACSLVSTVEQSASNWNTTGQADAF